MPVLAKHKTAHREYEILEKFETALMLTGMEVKAIREGRAVLLGAHVIVRGGEAFVVGMQVAPYQPNNTADNYDPVRPRKLLLRKKELSELIGYESKKGFTLIPLSIYTKGRRIKMEVAVVRGKKKFDKREDLKKRTHEREVARDVKNRT